MKETSSLRFNQQAFEDFQTVLKCASTCPDLRSDEDQQRWKKYLSGAATSARKAGLEQLAQLYEVMEHTPADRLRSFYPLLTTHVLGRVAQFFAGLRTGDTSRSEQLLSDARSWFDRQLGGSARTTTTTRVTEQLDMSDEGTVSPEMIDLFIEEAVDIIDTVVNDILRLEQQPENTDLLNAVFRAAHTIKGNAATLGFEKIKSFAHSLESSFDLIRKKVITPAPEVVDALSRGFSFLGDMVRSIENGKITMPDACISKESGLLESLDVNKSVPVAEESGRENDVDAPEEITRLREAIAQQNRTLRIESAKLDSIVNLMGEVSISNNMVVRTIKDTFSSLLRRKLIEERQLDDVTNILDTFNNLIISLQRSVIEVRMIPIEGIFKKFPKIVRTLARQTGKEVEFSYSGAAVEVDKNIYEEIADPLMHLLRNCVDHGIEPPDVRKQLGKQACGSISLSARVLGSQVIITVEDDGKGIDKGRIIAKALENGIITADKVDSLSDKDIYDCIFYPGFSTKEKTTDLSGRGVGMDVVRANIQKLKGSIAIFSTTNAGTRFVITLPTSLAIQEVMVVSEDIHTVGIPVEHVVEVLDVPASHIQIVENKEVLDYRGKLIPFVYMRNIFGIRSIGIGRVFKTVVLRVLETYFAVTVDVIERRQQIVLKPLSELVWDNKYINSGSILGDGSILLVLDVIQVCQELDLISPPALRKKEYVPVEHIRDYEEISFTNYGTFISRDLQEFILLSVDTCDSGQNTRKYFALGVSVVDQVLDLPALSVFPDQGASIAGYMRYMENAIPVFDLPLSVTGSTSHAANPKVVIVSSEGMHFGILSCRIHKIIRVKANEVNPIPQLSIDADSQLISGLIGYDSTDVAILDTNKLFQRIKSGHDDIPVLGVYAE